MRGLCAKHLQSHLDGSDYRLTCPTCRPGKLRGGGINCKEGQDTCAVARQISEQKCHNKAQRKEGCRPSILLVCAFKGKRKFVLLKQGVCDITSQGHCLNPTLILPGSKADPWDTARDLCVAQTGFEPSRGDILGSPVVLHMVVKNRQTKGNDVQPARQIYVVQLPYRYRNSVLSKQVCYLLPCS